MELRQLRYFVAVAEELHFGRAAQRLGIVQPAVSQQISRLERELRVQLLTRTPRRVALTSDGTRLLGEARAALAAADRVVSVAQDLASGRSGVLRLGTSPLLGHRLVRGAAALRACAPDAELVLVDGTPAAHAAAIAAGDLDAALVRGRVDVVGVRAVPLWEDPLTAVLPAAHPAAQGPVEVEKLADLRLRLPPRTADPALHDAVLARCLEAGVAPPRGRDVLSIDDAAVEIGTGDAAWTVVVGHRPGTASCTVALRPFDPPLAVVGHLLVTATAAAECAEQIAGAFR